MLRPLAKQRVSLFDFDDDGNKSVRMLQIAHVIIVKLMCPQTAHKLSELLKPTRKLGKA